MNDAVQTKRNEAGLSSQRWDQLLRLAYDYRLCLTPSILHAAALKKFDYPVTEGQCQEAVRLTIQRHGKVIENEIVRT